MQPKQFLFPQLVKSSMSCREIILLTDRKGLKILSACRASGLKSIRILLPPMVFPFAILRKHFPRSVSMLIILRSADTQVPYRCFPIRKKNWELFWLMWEQGQPISLFIPRDRFHTLRFSQSEHDMSPTIWQSDFVSHWNLQKK